MSDQGGQSRNRKMQQRHLLNPIPRLLLLCLLLVACSQTTAEPDTSTDTNTASDTHSDSNGTEDAVEDTSPADDLPALSALNPGWNELWAGGETNCSRGSPYAFYVRPGTVPKVILNFEGGGACWNRGTCSVADAIFKDSVQEDHEAFLAGYVAGLLDHEHPDHPMADWHHIYIPYCTGDVHTGSAVVEYGDGDTAFTIRHQGAINVRRILDWLQTNYAEVEAFFMTGCSAGSYGSIYWSPHIAQMYPDARLVQFGDSGCGVITATFLEDSFPVWNATANMPTWIEGLDPATVNITDLTLTDLYIRTAEHLPNQLFSQFTTLFDENQGFYYDAMGGGNIGEWSELMLSSLQSISESAENFRRYIAPGENHCIIPYNEVFTLEVEGVLLRDWIQNLTNEVPVSDVLCAECQTSPEP